MTPRPARFALSKAAGLLALSLSLAGMAPAAVTAPVVTAGEARTFFLFSLTDAPVDEVATAVLGEALTYPFAIDDGVSGTMTFKVADAFSEDELLERFALALAERDLALVRADGALRVMARPAALAQRPTLDIVGLPRPVAEPVPPSIGTVSSEPAIPDAVATEPKDGAPGWLPLLLAMLAIMGLGLVAVVKRRRVVEVWRTRTMTPPTTPRLGGTRDDVVDAVLRVQPVDLAVLAEACETAARRGMPVEQALRRHGAISDDVLAQAYAAVSGLDLWSPKSQPPIVPTPSFEAVARTAKAAGALVVAADDWSVTVATPDPFDDAVFNALCRSSGRMVTLLVARVSDLPRQTPEVPGPANDDGAERLGPLHRRGPQPGGRGGAALLQEILARQSSAA